MVKSLMIEKTLKTGAGNDQKLAWSIASSVLDPEIPCVTIGELGIIRDLKLYNGKAIVSVSPTYSGCPAVLAIELAIEAALLKVGFETTIKRVLSPPWTTDWISEGGRNKLKDYGIAPPVNASSKMALFGHIDVECPRCSSRDTEKLSEFGSTACKAQYRCKNCFEPFDYFKCI